MLLSGTGLHRLQLHLLYYFSLKLQAKEKAMESRDVKTVPTLMQPYEIVYFSKAPNALQRSNSSQLRSFWNINQISIYGARRAVAWTPFKKDVLNSRMSILATRRGIPS